MKHLFTLIGLLSCIGFNPALAGSVDVVKANAERAVDGSYTFHVSLRHEDTGWDHFANRWEIMSTDGKLLATRVLNHPHVDEQPFTRSLAGVKLPPGTTEVIIRGHDSVHGYQGKTLAVKLR